jgi:16S rRNA processing protein RimM
VQIPASERMALPAGSYYVSDLVGCEVRERGTVIGRVREVQFPGGTPLLVVDSTRSEVLIPLAEEICVRIDTQARSIEVILPDGLRDLNQT